MTYTLLSGVRVLELSLLAPYLLGMHLADLGADVIKIEQPPGGDYVRELGAHRAGGLFEQDHPVAGPIRLFSTPIRSVGEEFSASPAPAAGEHSESVLRDVLGLSAADVATLRDEGVV